MTECPMCGGAAGFLGQMGAIYYFRCRDCGWEFPDTEPGDEDEGERS